MKLISLKEAARLIPDGASVMFGGFLGCGSARRVIEEMAELGVSGLTVICNDGGALTGPDGSDFYGVAKLIHNRQVKKLIASHVGLNPEVASQMNEGSLEVTLIPQGSLAEMIRSGGAGLGGVLTPTGLGTIVQDAWHVQGVVEVEGRKYLLEKPLRADFAVIGGYKADKAGNIWYKGTMRNFNPIMATAADIVIAEIENIVDIGEIEPENVVTQGILVDFMTLTEEARHE